MRLWLIWSEEGGVAGSQIPKLPKMSIKLKMRPRRLFAKKKRKLHRKIKRKLRG